MSLRVNQNVTSLSTYSNLSFTSHRMEKSIAKLSSGLRINTAADDAAGLAISEKMRSQVRGLNRAKLNAQDGISMIQTAEGGLNETESIMQRMRELAIQGSNDTLTSNDRLEIQKEINQLRDSIDDISHNTEFNTKKLLNGSQTAQITSSSSFISGSVTSGGVNGGDYSVNMKVIQGGISQMQQTQIFMDKTQTDQLAAGSTKLKDIAQFYDENGVFALANQQTLTINGNASSTSFTVDGEMTLNQLAAGLQNAISSANGLGIKNSSAFVVGTVISKVSGLGGYIQLTSGIVGNQGNFSIAGDQAIMDALGISVTRESVNNVVEVRSQDMNGNVRTVKTSSDRASGLLNGVDMIFDNTAAQISGHGGIVDGLKFSASNDSILKFEVDISIAGVTTKATVQITFTAGTNYSLDNIAAKINNQINSDYTGAATGGLGAESGMEASVVDGQIRLSYTPNTSYPELQSEIKITSEGGVLGFTNGTYTGYVDGDKNTDYAVKGISLVSDNNTTTASFTIGDGSGSTKTITVGKTVLTGSAADLVEINDFLISANKKLVATGITVRVDMINNSMAFTSTNLGTSHDGTNNYESKVSLSSTTMLSSMLGVRDGVAKGTGDTNFRLRIVDNSSMLQIGANEGQNMQLSIGDMSARSLGIDKLDMTTVKGAQDAIGRIDQALSRVSAERSKLGAFSNRLDYTMNNLENTATNLTDSESRIRDVDMANEMINFTSSQILQQAGTAMLAQANMMGQSVLSLLG